MQKKQAVGAIITNKQGHILLVTNVKWTTDTGEDVYIVPGGKVEKNETPEQALHREIYEELGIAITIVHRFEGSVIKKPGTDFTEKHVILEFIDFVANPKSEDLTICKDEIQTVVWKYTAKELLAMHEKNEILLGKTMPAFLQKYIDWKQL